MRMNSDTAGIQGPGFCLVVLVGLVLGLAAPVAQAQSQPVGQQEDELPAAARDLVDVEIETEDDAAAGLTAAQELALEAEAAIQAEAATAQPLRRAVTPRRPQIMTVTSVTVGQSAYLTDAQISAAIAALIGRQIDVQQAAQLANIFNAAYAENGFGIASAAVSEIDPRTGDVRIRLIEPRIGQIRVADGVLATGEVYARRLALPQGALADLREIEQRQLRLQSLSGIATEMEVAQGTEPDTVDLVFTPVEPPARSTSLTLDNHGNRGTGRERAILSFSHASLTGNLDPLSASLTLARGVRSASAGYARPVTADGLTVFGSASMERTRSITGPELTGRTATLELGVSVPVMVERDRQVTLRASAQHFREQRRSLGVVTTDQRGSSLTFGANFARFSERGGIGYDQTVRVISWRDAVLGSQRTVLLAGEGSGSIMLGADWQAFGRLGWQAAFGQNVPSTYRVGLTSPTRVRGYDPSVSSGDGFVFGSAQFQRATPWTVLESASHPVSLFPFAFVDAGRAFDRSGGTTTSQDTVISAGLGTVVQVGQRGVGEFVVAMPLRDANGIDAKGRVRLDIRLGVRF